MQKRTDIASEACELYSEAQGSEPSGIDVETADCGDIELTRVFVRNEDGASAIGKPIGRYITAQLPENWERDDASVHDAAHAIARELTSILPRDLSSVLIVGLGNRHITADALGPQAIESVIVTRHLKEHMAEEFRDFANVSAIAPGVLGLTGVETGEIVSGVCSRICPKAVIAIDALASRSLSRLCRTIQLSDTGITPGGGVGNARAALDEKTLNAPVIAIGVPTVVDAWTLAADICEQAGGSLDESTIAMPNADMVVTPTGIDLLMAKSAKIVGYAINLALQGDMSVAEMEQFLS